MPWISRAAALGAAAALLLGAQPAAAVVTDVVFILDSSGSILAANYNREKAYVDFLLEHYLVTATTSMGLVNFSSTVQAAPIRPLAGGGADGLQDTLDGFDFLAGSTFTLAAMDSALSLFTRYGHPEDRRLIFLMTDGLAATPAQDPCGGSAAANHTLQGLAAANVTTYLIGLGTFRGRGMECLLDNDPSRVLPDDDLLETANIINRPPIGQPAGVPEPASWAMMITGFGAAGAVLRRRRAAAGA